MLEKIVYDQVLQLINENYILDELQSGFRKNHSTGTALVRITEDMRHAVSKGEVTVLVLLDFNKAFDSVNHSLLLDILKYMNFSSSVVAWFNSYLSFRSQCVRIGETYSDWIN
jgi:hypothetical protein